ncbi:hypothetical protein C823_005240 [Eubacterium plexicaudatum ASF492]|uniref:Uncharacterized protein n=1 Tax=Eubacterium plexicaudatum ASF492 TaxID=1235802 RepID=N2B2T2_9FIRM|nr:hypothetical protein C823_005240 [Eubacterium plexicaudatum ASF492]
MEQLFMELEKMESVSCGDDYMHIITADGDKIIKISDLAKAITDGEFIKAGANGKIVKERIEGGANEKAALIFR